LAATLVNGIQAVGQASHSTRVDILSEDISLAGPTLGERITEWLNLRYQISMGDLEGAASPNSSEIARVELLVVMVGRALVDTV
jgi:hypothetical protein